MDDKFDTNKQSAASMTPALNWWNLRYHGTLHTSVVSVGAVTIGSDAGFARMIRIRPKLAHS